MSVEPTGDSKFSLLCGTIEVRWFILELAVEAEQN